MSKHLVYRHSVNRSLAETILGGIHKMLPARLQRSPEAAGLGHVRGRLIVAVGWLIALAVQAALLLLVAELVEVAHGVMELYLDLAQQQLDLTSLYVSATSPA
jgi:hypothetical protein